MGPRARRERERQELKDLILDHARLLFITEGYERASMRRLAEQVEYSVSVLYRHFKDKETLFSELCQRDFTVLMTSLETSADKDDPIACLSQVARAFVSFAIENPNHYRLLFMTSGAGASEQPCAEDAGKVHAAAYASLREIISAAIQVVNAEQSVADADLATQVFFASLHGLVSVYLSQDRYPHVSWRPIMEQCQLLVELCLRRPLKPIYLPRKIENETLDDSRLCQSAAESTAIRADGVDAHT